MTAFCLQSKVRVKRIGKFLLVFSSSAPQSEVRGKSAPGQHQVKMPGVHRKSRCPDSPTAHPRCAPSTVAEPPRRRLQQLPARAVSQCATADKLCFCKNNKRTIIISGRVMLADGEQIMLAHGGAPGVLAICALLMHMHAHVLVTLSRSSNTNANQAPPGQLLNRCRLHKNKEPAALRGSESVGIPVDSDQACPQRVQPPVVTH
jgi:hypothetical protein